MPLRTLHKHEVFNTIRESGVDPLLFERIDDENFFRLNLRNSTIYFSIVLTPSPNYYTLEYSTYLPKWSHYRIEIRNQITGVLGTLKNWLRDHVKPKLEDDQYSDPWEGMKFGYSIDSDLNEPFKNEEIKRLSPAIDKLQGEIESVAIGDEHLLTHLKEISNELREIKEELKNAKKKSWRRQFLGWAFNLMQFIFKEAPQHREQVMKIIKEFMSNFEQPLIS